MTLMEQSNTHSSAMLSQQEIQTWLVSRLARQLNIEPNEVDIQEEFTNYGLNSIEAINLVGELETMLACKLSPTLLWDYSCIEALVPHLAEVVKVENNQKLLANLDQIPESAMDALLNSMLSQENI